MNPLRSLSILNATLRRLIVLGAVLCVSAAPAGTPRAAEFDVYRLAHVSPVDARRMLHEMARSRAGELQIVVDAEQGGLMVGGPHDLRAWAAQILGQIDRPPALPVTSPGDVVRAYPVDAVHHAALMSELHQLFTDQVRLRSDPAGGRLIVAASPAVHERIAGYLSHVSASPGPLSIATPSAGGSQSATSAAVSHPPGEPLLSFESQLSAPPTGMVTGPLGPNGAEHHSAAAPAKPLTYRYSFRNRHSGEIVQALQSLLPDRMRPTGPGQFVLSAEGPHQLAVRFDEPARQCELAGTDSLLPQFVDLLSLLDSPQSEPGRLTRFIAVRHVEPARLQQAIDAWRGTTPPTSADGSGSQTAIAPQPVVRLAAYQALGINGPTADQPADQPPQEAPPAAQPLRRPSSDIEIQSLPDLDVIILRGRSADVEELTRIINEIERISAETTPEVEVYFLQHVRGQSLDELIADVLEDLTGTLQGRVSITPLLKPNALLLIGWGEAVEAAKKLIAELDQPVPAETQVRVFPLKHAPAAQMQDTIEQFYADRTGLAPQFEITADPRSNALIVNASPRDLEELELLIRRLDVAESQAVNQGRIIRLKNTLAADIAQTLQTAIDAARGGGTGPDAGPSAVLEMLLVDPQGRQVLKSGLLNDVRITADARTNALIVTGPAESMDLIEALVRELDETPASTAQIKVFQVVNGDATEMVLMLRSLFPAQPGTSTVPQLPAAEGETSLVPVRFSVDTRTNSIIATGSAGDLRIIEALLARLDAEEAQQRINRVYRLRNSPALDVAAAVNDFLRSERIVQQAAPGRPNPFQQIESEVVVVAEPVGNSLIISASPRFFEEIFELVQNLDEQPPQVLVQVIIAEVDLDNFHELGVELGLQDSFLFDRSLLGDLITTTMTTSTSTPNGIVTSTNEVIQAASLAPGFNFNNLPLGNSGSDKSLATSGTVAGQALSHFNLERVNTELGYGGLVLSASSENVSVLLRALDQKSHVEILSRPQIMTLDNQPAFIQVGQRVPRIVATSINNIGQVNTVELEDVGLILGLTPRISPEGMVVMDIDAEKSQVGPEREGIPISVSAEGAIVRSPRVDITRAQTTVSAASGQTVVLGGLITNDTMSISRRVPWLSDIPLLGQLFKYDSDRKRRKELLIIMTPHVIRGVEDAEYFKQVEMARMSWCSADFFSLAGPSGPVPLVSGQVDDEGVPVIYPDHTPGLEWRDQDRSDPASPMPGYPLPMPTPAPHERPLRGDDPALERGPLSPPALQPTPVPISETPSPLRPASFASSRTEPSASAAEPASRTPKRRLWPFRLRKNTPSKNP